MMYHSSMALFSFHRVTYITVSVHQPRDGHPGILDEDLLTNESLTLFREMSAH
jgi:hypothetical protein